MTNFIKENFRDDGMYCWYYPGDVYDYDNRVFIARDKYRRGGFKRMVNFLVKNCTVEHYQAEYADGKAPMEIFNDMGFLFPGQRRICGQFDQPCTMPGYRAAMQEYIADRYPL